MINRVLLYNSGGGIGDALQILPLVYSLKKEFKFDYLKLSISKEIDIRDNKVDITIDKEISND